MVIKKLEKALESRRSFLEHLREQGDNTYRFFSSDSDGVEGLVIECFGTLAVFQFHQGKCALSALELRQAGEWCLRNLGVQSVYLKVFQPDRSSGPAFTPSTDPLAGPAVSGAVVARENGVCFQIRPTEIYSVGLFLDQRENRKALASSVNEKDSILNLFSYTCAFSVYCAKAGAVTTSVDVSGKYLEWGKENFQANGLELGEHRFFAADARYFLRAAAKRSETYRLIIVDPPSFARGKKNEPFSVKRNLGEVLEQCGAVLAPGGSLFVSTNFAQWQIGDLDRVIEKALGQVTYLSVPHLPQDYKTTDPIIYRWLQRKPNP